MTRLFLCLALIVALALAASADTITAVINGKTITVPTITVNGVTYLDIAALVKLLGPGATFDAAAKKLVIAPAPATPPATNLANWGVPQLPGENGQFGAVYKMGKEGQMYYFRLNSAEYTTSQVTIGDRLFWPKADEKLLLLRFSVQNPNKVDTFVRYDFMKMMVVDAMNVNHEGTNGWGDAENKQDVAITLKPSQRIDCYTFIRVPAKGIIPKLIVQKDPSLLRYDLHDVVKTLEAPVVDPNDAAKATALEEVPALTGVSYPCGAFNITVQKFETVKDALVSAPKNGGTFLVATLLIKNMDPKDRLLRADFLKPELLSADGEVLRYGGMLFATANRPVAQDLKAGQEMAVRLFFEVPKGVTPKTVTIKEYQSRGYRYDIPQ